MKAINFFSILIILVLGFQSCTHDRCERETTFIRSIPIWKTTDEIRASIQLEEPRALKNPGKIYFYNNYIFVNEQREGVHFINNTNPENPIKEGFIAIPGNVDIAIKDKILYADTYIDLVAIDISDLNNVQLRERKTEVFPHFGMDELGRVLVDYEFEEVTEVVDCETFGGFVFWEDLAFENSSTLDVAFSADFNGSVGAVNAGVGGSLARFTIADDYLYTIDWSDMHVFNLTIPEQPSLSNTVAVGWNIETIFPYEDKLFIGASSGMFIFDRSVPDLPTYLAEFTHANACDPVFVKDNYAYVTLRSGNTCNGFSNQLDLIDISNVTRPQLEKSFPMDNPHGLSIKDNDLFICEGEHGLKVFDIEVPEKLDKHLLDKVKNIHAVDAIVVPTNKKVLLVIGNDGFYQYDFENSKKLKLLSSIPVER